ncbi:MAG: ATP-binding cassette domain-containing protein [Lachnospiraceae bacterium]|nr:ATP-binding cassette domain-containing protein [Lachnospiraceae bacterium]MBF1011570.1 ATP-binding cassette domain-containing protein [Lachnospiraceae bacterium]
MASEKIIVKGIRKSFGTHVVLQDLSITFAPGGIYVIRGTSGSGKTTLLRILAGLEQPDEGEVIREKREAPESLETSERLESMESLESRKILKTRKADAPGPVGMVFQESRLLSDLSAIRNVAYGVRGKIDQVQLRAQLREVLPEADLTLPVHQYSGGMRRRVEMVRAVFPGNGLLLLDEPFAGLDVENKKRTISYLLSRRKQATVICTSHDPAESRMLQAGEIFLSEGKVQEAPIL